MRSGVVAPVPISAKRVLSVSDALRNDEADLLPTHTHVKAQRCDSTCGEGLKWPRAEKRCSRFTVWGVGCRVKSASCRM